MQQLKFHHGWTQTKTDLRYWMYLTVSQITEWQFGGVSSSNFRWAPNPCEHYCNTQLTNPTVKWTPPGSHSPNSKVLCVRVYVLNRQPPLKYCFMWSDMPVNFPWDLKITDICWRKRRTKLMQQLWQTWPLVGSTLPSPGKRKITITPGELNVYNREGEKINLFDSYNPFLSVLVSDDIKHVWSLPIGDAILSLCIFTQIGVIGFNSAKRSPRWCRLRRVELVGAWKNEINFYYFEKLCSTE